MEHAFDLTNKNRKAPPATVLAHPTVGYADDLFGIAVPKEKRELAQFPVRQAGPSTPKPTPYVFRKEHIKTAQFWLLGLRKNLLLTGPTGSGKTSFIEQLAARVGWEVIKQGCTGSLEFQELIGRITLKSDGSTGWQDGPVLTAMRTGAIVLLDEINFLHPDVVGGLNGILDGGSYLIPETGERVFPHADFRIAATGNGINGVKASNYKGVKRQNDSLLDRFTLGIEVDYMASRDEAANLAAVAPKANPKIIEMMVQIAEGIRKSYDAGDSIKVTLSSRVLIAWADIVQRLGEDLKSQAAVMLQALETVYLFRVEKDDKATIVKTVQGVLQRHNLST